MSLENAFVKSFSFSMMLDMQGFKTWIHTDDHIINDLVSTVKVNGEGILPLVVIGVE